MKKFLSILILTLFSVSIGSAQNRFPKPDFESGYKYPDHSFFIPNETLLITIDLILLVLLMSFVAWAVIKKRTRMPIIVVSVISVIYFGFFRNGCVCSIGSIQNVALALADNSYAMPLSVLLIFLLPIIFALLFGRVFCAGVCPFGALQELVNIKNYKLSKALTTVLGIIPWLYLIFAVLYAVTRTSFLICRFDPFIGIFRLGGDIGFITFGVILLIASIFTGRPFCRFICPYGALLSLFSRVSIWKTTMTTNCINCELCHNACPVDAIMPPYDNKVKESRIHGVKRILTYFVFLPVMIVIGALTMRMVSDSLGSVHKDVRLHSLALQNEARLQDILPLDLEVFYGQGGTLDELTNSVNAIKADFKLYSTIAGGFIGLTIGIMLVSLSVKRSRKLYEIDDAACVNCARCFSYCPQNKMNQVLQLS